MKIIGTFIIIICLAANAFIGLVLYNQAYGDPITLTELGLGDDNVVTSSTLKDHRYEKYGFSFSLPEKFISGESDIENGLIDYLVDDSNIDGLSTTVFVYSFAADVGDSLAQSILTSEQYSESSRIDFENRSKDSNIEYFTGGTMDLDNGIRLYYNVISSDGERLDGVKVRVKEKNYSFFHNGNSYEIIWQDDMENFDKSVIEFDEYIKTLKIF